MNITRWTKAVQKPVAETVTFCSNQGLWEFLTNEFDFMSAARFANIFYRGSTMSHKETRKMPVYVYKIVGDKISPLHI
jgi:hypothetical protein